MWAEIRTSSGSAKIYNVLTTKKECIKILMRNLDDDLFEIVGFNLNLVTKLVFSFERYLAIFTLEVPFLGSFDKEQARSEMHVRKMPARNSLGREKFSLCTGSFHVFTCFVIYSIVR